MKGRTLVLVLRSALVARLHSCIGPVKITPRRKYLTPKISVGALMGAQCQLAGTETNFLTKGLYLTLESYRMLSLEMSETTDSQQQKKGEFLIESNLDYVHTNSPARI